MMKYLLVALALVAVSLAQEETTEEPIHPSCSAEAEMKCNDECREKNYELLDEFVFTMLGDEGDRRRRGVLSDGAIDFLSGYLRNNARCNQVRFRKKRNGECVCKCKTKPIRLDCGLIENGGFQQGGEWKVDYRGEAVGEVTDDTFFSHVPSPLPLGQNGNYQGIAAGIDHICDGGLRRRRGFAGPGSLCDSCGPSNSTCGTGPGQIVLRQHFKVPEDADHVVLVYGMATDGDGFMPFVGPNAQGYRVDIMTEKAPKFSAADKHVVMPLITQSGFSEPNLYAHDITKGVANGGGKFVLRFQAAALLSPQSVQVDHVHMCALKCGRDWEQSEREEEEEEEEEPTPAR